MTVTEIFQVLGIPETKDEATIKNAYRERLSVTNPEDNPEGFKRLRAAYEEAVTYARTKEEESAPERDETESGRWVERVSYVYRDIRTRRDISVWEELFADEIFQSLEEEENCRYKLLAFLMDHFKLPTAVWKLLDRKLSITEGAAGLRETYPVEFVNFIVSRCERGEDVEFDQFEGEPEAEYDLYLQYYDQCWHWLSEKDYAQAEEFVRNADGLGIRHPVMEICRALLAEAKGDVEAALEILQGQRAKYPKDIMILYNMAELLWRAERRDEAAEIYQEIQRESEKHYVANLRLTEWHCEKGRPKEAKVCAERVLNMGADNEFMELVARVNAGLEEELLRRYQKEDDWEAGLELGWCYLQDGAISRGVRIAQQIRDRVSTERRAEHTGLMAKLFVEGADYEEALKMAADWEEELHKKMAGEEPGEEYDKDMDRVRQSHLIRVQCYAMLGHRDKAYFSKAIEEAEKARVEDRKDFNLMLQMAGIYTEMEEYEKSQDITDQLITQHEIYAAGAAAAENFRRQWDAYGVIRSAMLCIQYFPAYVRAYELLGKVYLDLERRDEFEKLLERAKENGIRSVILDAYAYQLEHPEEENDRDDLSERVREIRRKYFDPLEQGDQRPYEEGVLELTNCLYRYPGVYMLVERGIFHRYGHNLGAAIEDFEKALVEDPAAPYALNGLSFALKYKGQFEQALVAIKQAILFMDEDMSPIIYADQGALYNLLGDYPRALEAFRVYFSRAGARSNYHMNRMAETMMRCGDIDGAAERYRQQYANDRVTRYEKLTDLYQCGGLPKKAEELLSQWGKEVKADTSLLDRLLARKKAENPNQAGITEYFNACGWQELMYGSPSKAVGYFQRMHEADVQTPDSKTGLADGIFACILSGNDVIGKRFCAKLKKWRENSLSNPVDEYDQGLRAKAYISILADYYELTDEELEARLDAGFQQEVCHFCMFGICKELEAARVLLLLRKKEDQEALRVAEKTLEFQPFDEFSMAIRHYLKDIKKITIQESV